MEILKNHEKMLWKCAERNEISLITVLPLSSEKCPKSVVVSEIAQCISLFSYPTWLQIETCCEMPGGIGGGWFWGDGNIE